MVYSRSSLVAALVVAALLAAAASATPAPPAAAAPYCDASPPPIPALSTPGLTLKQVQVYIRHGDRTQAGAFPCWADDTAEWECKLTQLQRNTVQEDGRVALGRMFRQQYIPGREFLKGNCGVGMLTSIGYDQQHTNGANLRAAYPDLLPDNVEAALSQVNLRSDLVMRTIQSGQALFDGMYPTSTNNTQLVVPWNVRDDAVDNINPNAANCPALTPAYTSVLKSPAAAELQKKLETQWAPIAKQLGAAVSISGVGDTFDCVNTHLCHNKPIPDFIDTAAYNTIVTLVTDLKGLLLSYNSSRYARLGMGPLVEEIYGNMLDVVNSEEGRLPFFLYSAHDSGVMALLQAFGVFDNTWCPYAGLISWELYENSAGAYFVRMVYQGNVMQIPGCGDGEVCSLDDFADVVTGIVPTPAECSLSGSDEALENDFVADFANAARAMGIQL